MTIETSKSGRYASSTRRIYGFENIRLHLQRQKRDWTAGVETSIAQVNRHTGLPHEHRREIARRARRQGARQ